MQFRSILLASVALLVFAQVSCSAASEPLVASIQVGIGTGTVSGNVYAPNNVTIPLGTTLDFTITSDEVHSVTFVGKTPPPEGPPTSWERNLLPESTGILDGSGLINTGLIEKDITVSLEFPEEGSYNFICIIHPGMVFTANVVEKGDAYTTVAESEATIKEASEVILSAVAPLRGEELAASNSNSLPDGTSLWEVPTGGFTLTPAGPLQLMEYYPTEITVNAGDTLQWSADEPHSVTFLPEGQELPPGPPTAIPAAKPADEYDPSQFYHSGVFNLGPPGQAPTSFEMTFPEPGNYPYLCVLHWDVGHMGTVIVK